MQESERTRENAVGIFCGNRYVGKTTTILKIIENHPKKVLVYDLDDNDKYHDYQLINTNMLKRWKSGIKRIITPDYDSVFENIAEHINNALLVFEDATKYIEPNPQKIVQRIVLAAKQRNLDIIFTFHSFRAVPPKLVGWSDFIKIFKTGEDIGQFRSKIPQFERVAAAHARVEANKSQFFNETVFLR